MPSPSSHDSADAAARLMLVSLSLAWGLTWPAMKIALAEIPPFSMRVGTTGLATLTLFAVAFLQRRKLRLPSAAAAMHLIVGGSLNVAAFTLLTAFAQLVTTASRATVLTYTMPIWAALLAYPVLGERLTRARAISLLLCAAGLAVVIYPLMGSGDLIGLWLALTTAVAWAIGTVYLKWAQVDADPLAIAAWQVFVALVITVAGLVIFEGSPHLWPVHAPALVAVVFSGVIGSGVAYFMWFEIVRRLPAMTASLGVLSVPAVGVVSSMMLLGERPTVPDIIGFALIFAAAACVLLTPNARTSQTAPIEQ